MSLVENIFGNAIAVGILLLLAIIVGYFIIIFNSLVRVKNNIDKAWGNIDVLLKQRYDELPRLVETCKGYMQHEKNVLLKVTELRTSIMNASSIKDKAIADFQLSSAIKTLFAVAEKYPNLKANENFLKLQQRISGLENEIADRREFYNDSVNVYNIRIQSIPDLFVAKLLSFKTAEFFKVSEDEKKLVEVKV